jgi:hypothetical protein
MFVTINGNDLNVEVLGPENAPVLIAHHGGGGIGSLAEPKSTFGPLADEMRVVSSTPAAAAAARASRRSRTPSGRPTWTG